MIHVYAHLIDGALWSQFHSRSGWRLVRGSQVRFQYHVLLLGSEGGEGRGEDGQEVLDGLQWAVS